MAENREKIQIIRDRLLITGFFLEKYFVCVDIMDRQSSKHTPTQLY